MTTPGQIDFREDYLPAGERLTTRLAAHDDDDGMVVSLPAGCALFRDFHPQVQAIEVWMEGGSGFELSVQLVHEGCWAHSETSLDGKPACKLFGWFDFEVECSSKELAVLRDPRAILNWKLRFDGCDAAHIVEQVEPPHVILASPLVFIFPD
ncbi:MAG: hypothetical protein EPN60_11530 [Nevskiaceae bacterium]|nr:MAG: hypothetical protein EPO48_04145 [Nevskiaceae bacterium]TAM25752.1 MAG: hypothetical protein EPN60_11530 [Nevskiaceae bacterium]